MKNNILVIVKKQFELLCNFIEEGTFITMLIMWVAGYFAALAIIAANNMDKLGIVMGAILSITFFAIGYILYKSDKEEKEKAEQKSYKN